MTDLVFAPGDRVRVRDTCIFQHLVDRFGTITRRHPVLPDAYSVTFDGSAPYWITAGELALVRGIDDIRRQHRAGRVDGCRIGTPAGEAVTP